MEKMAKIDLLIFTGHPKAYAIKRLFEEAKRLGLKSEVVYYGDLDFSVKTGKVEVILKGQRLPVPEIAIFRTPGLHAKFGPQKGFLRRLFVHQGVRVLNQERFLSRERTDKINQYFKMAEANLPIVPSRIFGSAKELEKITDYPVIIKHLGGSQGRNVFKVGSLDEAQRIFTETQHVSDFLVQPFLPGGKDIRVIVLGGRALGAMRRVAQRGEFLTNFSVGGRVENYDLSEDPEAKALAEKVANLFKVDYTGVDLMKDDQGNWLILEINNSAQFEGFEKATGINVAKAIVEYLLRSPV